LKKFVIAVVVLGMVAFLLLQLVHPSIPEASARAEIAAPPEVRQILRKHCYSCHSDERRLSWFDQIEPAYWFVRKDVLRARRHLNFSTLGEKPAAAQKGVLFEAVTMIQLGAMPLPQFTQLHPDARVTPEEMATLKAYLAPWSVAPPLVVAGAAAALPTAGERTTLASVSDSQNGLKFDPEFENWKLIATTDRGDNNQFRLILGNDIAVKAAREGKIKPWPEGARFAKVAWVKERGGDGLDYAAKFRQVELMAKGAQEWKSTEGWGWGRWIGLDLKPYGKDKSVVKECTSCHLPVRGDDYVYTQPITSAAVEGSEIVNNKAAALPAELPYQPLDWHPIAVLSSKGFQGLTMSVLFANDTAFSASLAQSRTSGGSVPYPSGSKIVLVTWTQRDDPHWFGARVADAVQQVEFVEVGAAGTIPDFKRFEAGSSKRSMVTRQDFADRDYLLNLRPAPLP
jgi:mono/diheme cytochrome c family protein